MPRAMTARSPARMPRASRAMSGPAGSVRLMSGPLGRNMARSRHLSLRAAAVRDHDRKATALHRLVGTGPRENKKLLGRCNSAGDVLRLGAEFLARRFV